MTPLILLLTTAITTATGNLSLRKTSFPRHRQRSPDNRNVFSPRMDYEEWTPLGRGDPLKNDPTYDYVPPVLERVHYWVDPSKRTPDPPVPNSEIMVLGERTDPPATTTETVTSRFATMTLLDPFLKFMESSKASLTNTVKSYLTTPTPYAKQTSPSYGPPLTTHPGVTLSYEPPMTEPHPTDFVPPPPPKVNALQRPPYTMLMPPPPPATSTEVPVTLFATSTGTTSEASMSSSTTITEVASTTTDALPQTTTNNLANSENLYKPVAINMPEMISNETIDETLSFFLPTPSPESQTFNHENHINFESKLPSFGMVPPPKKTDNFYSFRPTTVRPTTTARTLTTDPMFKHYKQPSEPLSGPFYLIIQGHSKVKKYGASKNKVKDKIKVVASNEINYEEMKMLDFESMENQRRERKLKFADINQRVLDENEAEIIEGRPTVELSSSFQAAGPGIQVGETPTDHTYISVRRNTGRRLLAAVSSKPPKKGEVLDDLGLESLIALSDDYNSEDVINLLLKEEGQGSGLGSFVASLFGRSLKTSDEM